MSEPVQTIADRVLATALEATRAAGADVRVDLRRAASANVRFAKNEMTTSGESDELTLGVAVTLGKRQAWTSTNQVDPASVRAAVDRALTMAKLAPEDPETMPMLGSDAPKASPAPPAWDDALASMSPADRVAVAGRAIAAGDRENVQIAGFLQRGAFEHAIRTSRGLAAAHRETEASYTVTARTHDGTGSGWGGREVHLRADLDDLSIAKTAIDKAVRSAKPRTLPPGEYTVILEPQAVAEMLLFLVGAMNRRSADEGRSFFTGKAGQKLFADFVSLKSDPFDPRTPAAPFDDEGVALRPHAWIERGVAKDLFVTRYWAQKEGLAPTGSHRVHRLDGGSAASTSELVKTTKRGLLVTRFWYNRMLEPQTVMITGLTRDGLFLVEDGEIKAPLTNYRYNESPVKVLANVDAMTRDTVRVPSWGGIWHVPALRTHGFKMASASAAV